MDDTTEDVSVGALLLAVWSNDKMRWADVAVPRNETSFGKIKKDPDAARGRRMCIRGTVVQISKALGSMYSGVFGTDDYNFVRYEAAGSTGELIERSRARLCGVVTGVLTYRSAGGRTIHAVHMVGMFDLPENRAPM